MTDFSSVADEDAVGALMQDVLDKINAVFEQTPASLPDRQYLAIGQTAHDCEQLTVSFRQMYPGSPGTQANQPQPCNVPRTVVLTVQLVRKLPVSTGRGTTPPEPSAMTENTLERARDAWLLLEAVMYATAEYVGAFADVSITDPQGEYQAIVLNVTAGVP